MELIKHYTNDQSWTMFKIDSNILEDKLLDQHVRVTNGIFGRKLFDTLPIPICLLNSENKIIYSNKKLNDFIESDEISTLGNSIGRILGCVNYKIEVRECGKSKYCSTCGGFNAISEAMQGNVSEGEFKMIKKDNKSYNFRICASPVHFDNEDFIICTLTDIDSEIRKKVLERLFFHDILNTVTGIKGYMELSKEVDHIEAREFSNISLGLINTLVDEIDGQRLLLLTENNELSLEINSFSTKDILLEIKCLYESHDVAEGKTIIINDDAMQMIISSDQRILKRVLGNLIKNALEACNVGETVILNCIKKNCLIEYQISNPNYIPENIQLQIFHRPFTTKGSGRGIGTHSVKLLTEKYLKGRVFFKSSLEEGTCFSILLSVESTK